MPDGCPGRKTQHYPRCAKPSTAARAASNARSIPSRGTSRWVTARTVKGPMTLNRTPCEARVRAAN